MRRTRHLIIALALACGGALALTSSAVAQDGDGMPAQLVEARAAISAQDWDKAQATIEAFFNDVDGAEDNALAQFWLGYARQMGGDKHGAVAAYKQAIAAPNAGDNIVQTAYYNMACAQATEGHAEHAIESLKGAIDAGWNNLKALREDPDLASLQSNQAFQNLVEFMPGAHFIKPGAEHMDTSTLKPYEVEYAVWENNRQTGEKQLHGILRERFTRVEIDGVPMFQLERMWQSDREGSAAEVIHMDAATLALRRQMLEVARSPETIVINATDNAARITRISGVEDDPESTDFHLHGPYFSEGVGPKVLALLPLHFNDEGGSRVKYPRFQPLGVDRPGDRPGPILVGGEVVGKKQLYVVDGDEREVLAIVMTTNNGTRPTTQFISTEPPYLVGSEVVSRSGNFMQSRTVRSWRPLGD